MLQTDESMKDRELSYQKFNAGKLVYDHEQDGIWIYDEEDDPAVFLGRNVILDALALLPADPPAHLTKSRCVG